MSVLTRITNNIGTRRLPYIPPNGATLSTGQTIDVPGLLDTELYLADLLRLDEFRTDVALGRITVTYVIVQTAPENGRLSPYDKDLTPIATLGNYATTGLAITESPTDDSYVCLMVNGVMESLGNGARNRSFYFSNLLIRGKISRSILILPVVLYMPVLEFTIQCSIFHLMWQQSVPVWLHRWELFYCVQEQKANAPD